MNLHLPVIEDNGEVGDLSQVSPALFRPFSELPASLQEKLSGREKQRSPAKVFTTFIFDGEVLAAFKSGGEGWQTRINDALKEWLKDHSAA
jgi:uncharacterized protein (DUF4415 family)